MKLKLSKKILSLSLIAVFIFAYACNSSEGNEKNKKNDEHFVYVKTTLLKAGDYTDYIYVLGTAKAFYSANLSPDESGKVKKFLKDKGSFVKEGEVVVVLDNDVLKASLDAAEAQWKKAENNFTRQEQIFKENVISEQQYLNAKYERDAAKANYDLIKARYERTFIKAPFSGIVDKKIVEIGETVMPGTPVVSLVSIYRIKVEAGVPENYVNEVNRGDSVKVVFKDLGGTEYHEILNYVGNTISTNNRTFPIEIHINNSDGKIKPELSARIYIQRKKYENAIIIPEETITKTDAGYVVYVEENGVAKIRNIEIINRSDNKVAVKSGVKEGDKLITVGFQNLVDGTKVKVVN